MKQITINTGLIGKTETFKLLAVAMATGKPILLIGEPGTGKTNALLDFALAYSNGDAKKAMNDTFILETDESTRSPEIKGRPDLKKIIEQNTYDVVSPITQSKFILINEIDKANAGLRNSMLSIMNEKVLFNGVQKVPTPWDVFCASCNLIPSEEKNSPFWDRFILKHKVNRISKRQMVKYYKNQGAKSTETIMIPEPHELEQIKNSIPISKLEKFVNIAHKELSDRTLSFVPEMTAAVSVIFQKDLNRSLIKTAQILASNEMAKKLAQEIEAKEIAVIRDKIELVSSLSDYDQIDNLVEDIKRLAKKASVNPDITKDELQSLAKDLNAELAKNPHWNAGLNVQPQQPDTSVLNNIQNAVTNQQAGTQTYNSVSSDPDANQELYTQNMNELFK